MYRQESSDFKKLGRMVTSEGFIYMVWWVVVLSALFIWGGILTVRPSPGQRRIAAMRQSAIEKGLRIRLGRLLKLPLHQDLSDLVAYVQFRPRPMPNSSGALLRDKQTGQILHRSGCFLRSDAELEALSESLPSGCTLLASSAGDVMIGWDERGSLVDVERIAEALPKLLSWTASRSPEANPESQN